MLLGFSYQIIFVVIYSSLKLRKCILSHFLPNVIQNLELILLLICNQLLFKLQSYSMFQTQLSLSYFDQVPELNQISRSFPLSQITDQINKRDIDLQFQLIRALTETKKHRMLLRSNTVVENKKNRYPQQSIFEHSRVNLDENSQDEYINASIYQFHTPHCSPTIIISQGPIDSTHSDFTRMIVDQKIECIVMLCNYIENGKNKCSEYLSSEGWFIKEILEDSVHGDLERRNIEIVENDKKQNLRHIKYSGWPDKNVPDNPEVLWPIIKQSLSFQKILVHCSAGLGRSGVFTVLYQIIKQLEDQSAPNNEISIFEGARKLRQKRFGAVQNNQQYRFIYQFMQMYHEKCQSN